MRVIIILSRTLYIRLTISMYTHMYRGTIHIEVPYYRHTYRLLVVYGPKTVLDSLTPATILSILNRSDLSVLGHSPKLGLPTLIKSVHFRL